VIKHRSTCGRFALKSSVPCEFKLAECLLYLVVPHSPLALALPKALGRAIVSESFSNFR
jgi:hypothetical protein